MSVARKRRRYVRWLRYAKAVEWRFAPLGPLRTRSRPSSRRQGVARAGAALYRVAPKQQVWLWVELS